MMNWGYGRMMSWDGFGFLGLMFWLIVLVDLVLLGFWLWKQIKK